MIMDTSSKDQILWRYKPNSLAMAAKAKLFACFQDFDCGTPSPKNTPGAKTSAFYGENKENLDPANFQYHGGFTPNTEKNRRPLGNIAVSTAVLDAWMADNGVCRWIVRPSLLLQVRETARKPPRPRKRKSDRQALDCSR